MFCLRAEKEMAHAERGMARAERRMAMEEVFDNITVPYIAQLSAKLGKDKLLQVCKMYKSIIVLASSVSMHVGYIVHNASS